MSYLKFDRSSMSNLEEVLNKEILRTNRRGAYHCSTLIGLNTRKYHGLLVVPITHLGPHNYVLLSSLDETVIQHGAEFNLAVHKYEGEHFSPNGHKYIREYDLDGVPKTIYRVGGVILSKEIALSREDDRVLIRYTLLESQAKTTLRFRPLLGFRSVKELCIETQDANLNAFPVINGQEFCLYHGFPKLALQMTKENEYVSQPTWYKHFLYDKERERGHACTEDLPMPGYFEVEIETGESIVFSAGLSPLEPEKISSLFDESVEERTPRTSFKNCLVNAADQFYYQPNEERAYLMSGYPWGGVKARNMLIALTGCSFGIGKPERFHRIWNTFWPALKLFMETGQVDSVIMDIDKPDIPLWAVNTIIDYSKWTSPEDTREKFGETLRYIINYISSSRHPNMKLENNGLLYAWSKDNRPITWMDAEWDFQPVVKREGYIVEFNALWYNALCFYKTLLEPDNDRLEDEIARVSESFVRVFVNEHNYLFDYVNPNLPQDWSVRPNMLFAIGLMYSPLSRRLQRSVLDIVTKELLTPLGLRTLSPIGKVYKGYCNGSLRDRSLSYYNGGVWSWLMYPYLSAYLHLFRRAGYSFVERMMIPFEGELSNHGIGTISELYDATPPFYSRGEISYATSISAILRIKNRLDDDMRRGDDIFDIF